MVLGRARLADAERRADAAEERAGRCEARVALLEAALDVVPLGVVVAPDGGDAVLRNTRADAVARSRSAEALAAQAVDDALAEARSSGGPVERSLELHGPPPRSLVVSARRVPGATVAVIDDVTERRQVDAVRRDFVANVSHELRTPVGALSVLAEVLASERDPEVVGRLAARMCDEAARATRLIEDLLDLSRIEAAGAGEREALDLGEVVAEAVARTGAGTVEVDVAPGLVVGGDRAQLVSAVANLVENAVKYSDPGAPVRVRASSEEGWVEVAVQDRGIGIPAHDLDRVFERFYRVDKARSRDTGGTGLGLSIVRHVATNHGGSVTVQSREGEGSTFTVRLPAGDA